MLRVRDFNQLLAGHLREGHGGHLWKVVSPQAVEVFLFIVDTGSFSIIGPADEDVYGFKVAVQRETWPGFVHGSLERDGVAVCVSEDADLVVKQPARRSSNLTDPRDPEIDNAKGDQRSEHFRGLDQTRC
ncbi:MAG: hypothetical protein ABL961_13335 [Vicinamibacterales bacterium]